MSASNSRPVVPPAPTQFALGQEQFGLRTLAQKINVMLRGKVNAVTDLTLNASATTTTITDERIGLFSAVHLQATSATAAAAAAAVWVEVANGSATVHHDNTVDTDRTFTVLIVG